MKTETPRQVPHRKVAQLEAALAQYRQEKAGLQERLERYTLALRITGEGVWDWDLDTGGIWFSQRYYAMLGYRPEDFPPTFDSWVALLHPDDRERTIEAVRECIQRRQESYEIEFRLKTKAGTWRWILGRGRIVAKDNEGRPLRVLGTNLDITDWKESEKACEEIAASHRNLAKNLPGVVYRAFLRKEGRMQFFNDALEQITGFSQKELHCGQICYLDPLIVSEDHDRVFETIQEAILEKKPFEVEYQLITKNRGRRYVLERGQPVYDEDGAPLYIDGVILDISERKDVEDKLRESETKNRSILATVPDAITITRMADGRYLQANAFFHQVTGYAPQEVIGRTAKDLGLFVRSEDRDRFIAQLETIGEANKLEIPFRCKNGTVLDSLVSARRIVYGGEDCLVAVATDISERKRAEKALAHSENTLRAILSASPVGIARLHDRTIGWTNRTMTRILGYREDELLGQDMRILYPEDAEYQRVGAAAYTRLSGNRVELIDARMARKTGERFDAQLVIRQVDPQDASKGHILTLMDITEQKIAERSLKESEARFRSLAENALMGICIVRNGCVVYQNDACTGLFSDNADHGRPFDLTRVHPEDADKFISLYDGLAAGKSRRMEAEIRLHPPDGRSGDLETTWLHISASRIRLGEEPSVLFNVMDITHARRLEQIVRLKDKMSSLGRISAGIAHEIRNPLGGINMYLGVLKATLDPLGEVDSDTVAASTEVIDKIQAASNRIEGVIRRVMDFARPTAPRLQSVNLNEATENALALAAVSLRKHRIDVRCRLAEDLPHCYADRSLMEQVLLNMINNGAQAMESTLGERKLELVSKHLSGAVIIEVNDSGPGIPEDLREKIFDPFVTTRPDGSGIGLSISRRIVADHHGTLSVSDSPWGGATFSLRIPLEKRMNPR